MVINERIEVVFAFLILAAGIVIQRMLHKSAMREVFAHATEQGWELLIVDSFARRNSAFTNFNTVGFKIRFRERDGALVEGILERHPEGLLLVKSQRIPAKVARAIFDKHLRMDCRKCGAGIPSGAAQCPYCRAWRQELHIG